MAKKRISDVLIEVLANAGIKRIYGITGDSLNSVNDSLRRNGKIQFEHVRHEESAYGNLHILVSLVNTVSQSCGIILINRNTTVIILFNAL